ncbi:MarC family protein [Arachidicoccus sp.]|jgi:multiple antibiotic resistance protein|uniref:MarC family protein n=1 Tax=Arachidicoccus sp. TaxID=1872624 RepID=UPI003D1EC47D
MQFKFDHLFTISFTLFAVIDALGSIPLFISLKEKSGGNFDAKKISLISGIIMIGFLFIGQQFLDLMGLDVKSFALAGSIVIFLLGLEMILGHEIFKGDNNPKLGVIVPVAFPLIAGSATLTTIISLKAIYSQIEIIGGILINLLFVYIVISSLKWFEKMLGPGGILAIRKFFGVILLAIAVKIFSSNMGSFGV